jgi:hypothetical protein
MSTLQTSEHGGDVHPPHAMPSVLHRNDGPRMVSSAQTSFLHAARQQEHDAGDSFGLPYSHFITHLFASIVLICIPITECA